MMNRILSIVLIVVMTLSCTTTAIANAEDEITVLIGDWKVEFDVPPTTINNRTMVPLRTIFEALNASVQWNDATKTVVADRKGTHIEMTINTPKIIVDNEEKMLDIAPVLINDRTFVPVRAISEAFGFKVNWLEETQTVIINKEYSEKSAFDILKECIVSNGERIANTFWLTGYEDKISAYGALYLCDYDRITLSVAYNDRNESISKAVCFYNDGYTPVYQYTLSNASGTYEMLGTFDPYTYEFIETQSTVGSNYSEKTNKELINALELFDHFLNELKIGVKLRDLGIKYTPLTGVRSLLPGMYVLKPFE
ncbi:MAG: copper amine oxidase N-terminal domain-containing protein [Clostridia bacterium]|nr:copper amine oxidase N-terminal domain-containing protein [Clostridia bacterium]